jgi:hypothetical protein
MDKKEISVDKYLQRIDEKQEQNIKKMILSQRRKKSTHHKSIKNVTFIFVHSIEIITFEP